MGWGRSFKILIAMIFSGCATTQPARNATEFLFTTDKSMSKLLDEISKSLVSNKFKVRKIDATVGTLIIEPRKFSFDSNDQKRRARQNMQMRIEGGSVKVRIYYECAVDEVATTFEICRQGDDSLEEKINRVEQILLRAIEPAFKKHEK